jgi:ABC-type spermidine/putrescine transport system permease subunit II
MIPSLIIAGTLKTIDRSLENAAYISGVSKYKTIVQGILPLISRPVLVSIIICFILILNEISVSILVNPPGFITIFIRIYSLFHYNQEATASALCLIMAGLVIILYIILSWVLQPVRNSEHRV